MNRLASDDEMLLRALWVVLLTFALSGFATDEGTLPSHLLIKLADDAAATVRLEQQLPIALQEPQFGTIELVPIFREPQDTPKRALWYELGMHRWFSLRAAEVPAEEIAAQLKTDADLLEFVVTRPHEADVTPNDYGLYNMWGLTKMNCPAAWDTHHGNSSIIVTTIDTGCKIQHPDLEPNIYVNPAEDLNGNGAWDSSDVNGLDEDMNGYPDDISGWDFVSFDVDPGEEAVGEDYAPWDNQVYPDIHGHGTHVMGTAAATTDNGIGVAAASWNVTAMPLRAGFAWINSSGQLRGSGYTEDFAAAVQYAVDMGVRVISISFGGSGTDPAYETVMIYARMNNVLVFASAGNSDNQNLVYPAAYDSVIAVAATDQVDLKASFSTYGAWVDVSAPGVSINSTFPNSFYRPNDYGSLSGTSMASPNAAAVAALLLSLRPSLTDNEAAAYLLAGCDDIDPLNPAYAGLLGAGRINAQAALNLACQGFAPLAPVVIAVVVGDSVRLSWNSVPCATAYHLEYADQSDGIYSLLTTTLDTVVVDPTGVNVMRFYRVIAEN